MENSAIIRFINIKEDTEQEIEVPLEITANELIKALNEAYDLGMDINDIFSCYLVAENPIVFLRGNKSLEQFGVRNGTKVIYSRSE